MQVSVEYESSSAFDELLDAEGRPRVALIGERLNSIPAAELLQRQAAAAHRLLERGITFTVYGHDDGIEKVWPFDIVPRVIGNAEWQTIETGLQQRVRALNLFLDDIYGEQKIIADKIVRVNSSKPPPATNANLPDRVPPAACGRTLSEPIWFATPMGPFTFLKTMPAAHPECPTSWRTAKR